MFERHGSGQPSFSGAPNVSIGLRELLDAAPDIIFCCDQQGRFQWVSAATEAIAGVKASDLLGNSFTKLVPLPYRNHIARRYIRRARGLKSDPTTDVTRVQTAAGQEVWLSVRSRMSLRPDGELVFIGIARPMTVDEIALASGELQAKSEASPPVVEAPTPLSPPASRESLPPAATDESRDWSMAVPAPAEPSPLAPSASPGPPAPPASSPPSFGDLPGLRFQPFGQFPPPEESTALPAADPPSAGAPTPFRIIGAAPEEPHTPASDSTPEPLSSLHVAPITPFAPPVASSFTPPPAMPGASFRPTAPLAFPAIAPSGEPAVLPVAESNTQILAAIQTANEARAEAESRLSQLRAEHDAAMQRVSGLESERDGLLRERDDLRVRGDEAQRRRDEVEKQLTEATTRREAAERQFAEAQQSRETAERLLGESERRSQSTESERTESRQRLEAAERQAAEARQQLEAAERRNADHQQAREAVERRVSESQLERDAADRRAAELRQRCEAAERQAVEARMRCEAAERQAAETQRRYTELEQRAATGADARTQSALQQLETMRAEHRRLLDAARVEAAQAVDFARLEGARALEASRLEGAKALDEARFDSARALESARAEHTRALEAVRSEQARAAAADPTTAVKLEAARAEVAALQTRLAEAERRYAELQSQFAGADRRVQEAQNALSEAQAQAQLKGDFLATISHEIRTPMNGVMGMTHLLLETELDNDQRNLVEVIRNSSQALIHLINDTLDFSKLEAGRLEIETIDFDLRVMVDEVSALLAPMANAKALDFECQVSHEVPSRLKGDPGRIRQVLFNLGGNAVKFTEEGCVSVRVDRVAEDDARVTLKISVTDTGQGPSRDDLARVFQSASPPDASITRQYGGTGLGLAISRSLVALMGGEVGVETAEGVGSSFWFRISLDKQATPAYNAAPKNVQLRGMRVMLVDPSKNIRQTLKEMLMAWGCEADEAETADEALAKMRAAASEGKPHQVAMIEMQLPGMDGEKLGWAIRSDAALERTLTMLMTSVGRKGDAQRAQTMGFSAYLLKPIEWAELYDGLTEVIHSGPPTASGAPAALVTRHSLAEARRGRMRILLVEDNAVNQLVANWALQRLGYTIDVANNANECLSKSETQRYDLILMDIQMPDMDGFKTTTAIRTRERGGMRTPIVAMTGNTQKSELERCRAAGMDDCLPKPIDIGQMCGMVERWTRQAPAAPAPAPAERAPNRPSSITLKAPDLEKKLEQMARADGPAEAERPAGTTHSGPPANLENSGIGFAPVSLEPADAESPAVPIDNARLEGSSMGIAALRDTLLNTFLADVPPRLDRLAQAMVEHEAHRIEFEAHGLMGMCATIGAVACERVFAEIERLAAEERVSECTRLLPKAKAEVERTEAYISRLERILSQRAA